MRAPEAALLSRPPKKNHRRRFDLKGQEAKKVKKKIMEVHPRIFKHLPGTSLKDKKTCMPY